MKKIYAFSISFLLAAASATAQSFTDATSLIAEEAFNSGGCTAVADMDEDGFDDIVILDQSKEVFIYYQESNGTFTLFEYGAIATASQWGMAVGDVNQDGHKDIISGGNSDGVHYMSIPERGVSSTSFLPNGIVFMQGCNIADINNDGWLDFFACHDVGASKIWGNDGAGNLLFENWIDLTTTPASDNSGNYGSTWTDFDNDGDIDLYIAKCRQGVNDPSDPRRINMLFVNNGDGTYTEKAAEHAIDINEQSWTDDFADIDNDGDFDLFLTNHTNTLRLYENNGLGHYTEITEGSGLEFGGFFLQGKLVDFDNDGFVDLLFSGETWGLYRNNGDNTFSDISNTTDIGDEDDLHSFGIGDLNKDGFLDIYTSYGNTYVSPDMGNPDKLWMNDGNDNNWIAYTLNGTISNSNAVGAKVFIYGDWGVQVREVRAGESYGISNTFSLHFGIGENESIDQVVVKWPSGLTDVIENPAINTFHTLVEAECDFPTASVSASSAVLCEGQSSILTLTTSAVNFMWSNGAVTEEVEVSSPGNYTAIVWDGNCAFETDPISLVVESPIAPTISTMDNLEFCEGGSAILMGAGGENYIWSNGQTGESVEITISGVFSVTADVNCGSASSGTVEVSVIAGPIQPLVSDVTLPSPGTAELTGNMDELNWYLNEDDSDPVATGMTFTTPENVSTTEYWVESFVQYGGVQAAGGKADSSTAGQFHQNSNFWLLFDAYEDMVIKTVKVQSETSATRNIQVIDSNDIVVAEGDFLIDAGEQIVELNFAVPAGTGYGLRTTGNPQLWRDGEDSNPEFPYALGSLGSITSTSINGGNALEFYYFFYDWHVETPLTICYSDRFPVSVTVVGIEELVGTEGLRIFPVPSSDILNVELSAKQNGMLNMTVNEMSGRMVLTESLIVSAGAKSVGVLDISELASGAYTLTLKLNGHQTVRMVTIK